MRKLFFALTALVSFSAFSQQQQWDASLPVGATTEKEYNYLTKGLKIQEESGLDVIDGYLLQNCLEQKSGNYDFKIRYLVDKKDSSLKALSVIIRSYVSGKSFYLCVPLQNLNLTNQYWSALKQFEAPMAQTYAYVMSTLFTTKIANSVSKN